MTAKTRTRRSFSEAGCYAELARRFPAGMAVIRLRDPEKPESWELLGANDRCARLFTPSLQAFLRRILLPNQSMTHSRGLSKVFREARTMPQTLFWETNGRKADPLSRYQKIRVFPLGDHLRGLLFDETDIRTPPKVEPEDVPGMMRLIVWRADPRTLQIQYVNKEAEGLLGYWPERWRNEVGFLENHLHPEDREKVLRLCSEVATRDEARECECRMIAAAGSVHWFYLTMKLYPSPYPSLPKRLELGGVMSDITRLREMEETNRRLSRRLIHLRDEEQRRISRELHDGLGQLLIGLRMRLDALPGEGSPANEPRDRAVQDCMRLCEEAIRELRSMSYLLHPPGLDEVGLVETVREYMRGYSDRSGITVHLRALQERLPLGRDQRIVLFRIIQEALTNIHRHAHAESASVQLAMHAGQIELQVRDQGKGIPPEVLRQLQQGRSGVGLAAMRERVEELGGELEISSMGRGTTIRARIPVPAKPETKTAGEPNRARAAKAGD